MDRSLIILGAAGIICVFAAPLLLYPLIPGAVMEMLGGLTGFRYALFGFFLGEVVTVLATRSESRAKKVREEEEDEPEPEPVKPKTKFGAFKETRRAKVAPNPMPEAMSNGGAELDAVRSENAELKAIVKALTNKEEPPKPAADPVEEQLKAALANYQKSKVKEA